VLCHYFFAAGALFLAAAPLEAQYVPEPGHPGYVYGPTPLPTPTPRPRSYTVKPPVLLGDREVQIQGVKQMKEGPWYHLREGSTVQTNSFLLKADEIDYNEDTGDVQARGNVYLLHFENGEELWADQAEYNLDDENGKFWNVRGTAHLKIPPRQRLLTTTNPFYFQGNWAEKLKEKYVLHDGFITDCTMPKPWWMLRGPKFTIIPDDHAIGYRSWFLMRHVPLFFFPVIFKPLGDNPRRSGFLTPNIGNSSQRGLMVGAGFYWAINRSYEAAYRAQYFSERGFAHTVDVNGTPIQGTKFHFDFYDVMDRGVPGTNPPEKQGGYTLAGTVSSQLGDGFYGRAELNYLSSYLFRLAFSENYNDAINSEVHSTAFLTKPWGSYTLDFAFQRLQDFQSLTPGDAIVISQLPDVELNSREHLLWGSIPLYISWDASTGMLSRSQLDYRTSNFVNRTDVYPRLSTMLQWHGFSLVPSIAARETFWAESETQTPTAVQIVSKDLNRTAGEVDAEFRLPSFARVFNKPPKWMGDKLKHVIEAGATYKYVTGVNDFNNAIRFDATEVFSNTNQVEMWITNHLYAKRGDDVQEILYWDVRQDRYFDPTFGGVVVPGWCGQAACRNVVGSSLDLTAYAFLAGPRSYSPIVSTLRASPKPGIGIDWRTDYDPLEHRFVANSFTGVYYFRKFYSVTVGEDSLRPNPAVEGPADQITGSFNWGNDTRRGLNAGVQGLYDIHFHALRFVMSQVTYNTDCCGLSVQYGKWNIGPRFDTVFRVALSVANIGSFGTLRRQAELF
jgi:LPS-assembly protein